MYGDKSRPNAIGFLINEYLLYLIIYYYRIQMYRRKAPSKISPF